MKINAVLKYWILTIIYIVLGYFLLNFCNELFNSWNNPVTISNISWIKGRLGEIIAFGLSVVFIIYVLSSLILLIININKFGFKNINYKALSRLHSVVLTAVIIYGIIFSIIFLKF